MLFLQFIVSSLEDGKPTAFFDDEFRSPIYVQVRFYRLQRLMSCFAEAPA